MRPFLVLIQTAGNQAFIFATNKLRENVGASEITAAAGTDFVHCALAGRSGVQTIVSTSGKALLLVPSHDVGKEIVRSVTSHAVTNAPGLEVRGAIVEVKDFDKPGTLHHAVRAVHERHAQLAGRVPSPRERFLRLPVVADCATSGLPASVMVREGTKPIDISAVTVEKRQHAIAGWNRIREAVGPITNEDRERFRLAPGPDVLDEMGLEWHAVIHADGNGLGQVFLNFQDYLPGGASGYSNEDYAECLRKFSKALDEATQNAFRTALGQLADRTPRTRYLPVVPLVLGGDDLTVICDGRFAVQLARDFLRAFERETTGLAKSVGLENAPERFTSCAGVAIIKPHYPFHAAYDLAEQLLEKAKDAKKHNLSALDFHVLYDTASSDLDSIRDKLRIGGASLVTRPYVTTRNPVPAWARRRDIDDLGTRIIAMRRPGEDGPALSRGMLHDLREGLFQGVAEAEARVGLARGRHGNALDPVLTNGQLFFDDDGVQTTGYLDAIDLVDFWHPEETP